MLNKDEIHDLKIAIKTIISIWLVIANILAVLYLKNFKIEIRPQVTVTEVHTEVK